MENVMVFSTFQIQICESVIVFVQGFLSEPQVS